jgi:tRNA-dependent cyclodipeptide synthase
MMNGAERSTIVLGVSLSNRAFNRRYCAYLTQWLREQQPASLEVIVFDMIETINYQVFRGLDKLASVKLATRRGEELRRMFRSFDCEGAPIAAMLESETALRHEEAFRISLEELRRAYSKLGAFTRDVRGQALHNLEGRRQRHGDEFVLSRMDELAEYVLQELAYFYVLFRERPGLREIYPGPNLWVKERLFAGQYASEIQLTGLPIVLSFQTILLREEPVLRAG